MLRRVFMMESLTGLLAVLLVAGFALGRPTRVPDGRIAELVSVHEAAARARAFIDAVAVKAPSEPDPADTVTRGWQRDGGSWYWYGTPAVSETEDVYFGFYDSTAQATDQAAWDAPLQLTSAAAGTDRGESYDAGHFVRSDGQWVWSTTVRDAPLRILIPISIAFKSISCSNSLFNLSEEP